MECDAVIIGDSIVWHICATSAKGRVHTHCLPGACVLDVAAQTEILKKDFRSLVETVRTTSPTRRIIMSGPLPMFQRGIEREQLKAITNSHGVKTRNYPLLIIGIVSGSVLGSTVLMACTQAELEQQSSRTTCPGHYAPSD
ncbi:hypothetical protein QTP86_016652 [Hemibagrus guttatus]|nr:hypothetical protein QTP86_016652 [Hemibagrus guttatus]